MLDEVGETVTVSDDNEREAWLERSFRANKRPGAGEFDTAETLVRWVNHLEREEASSTYAETDAA